MRGVAHDRLLHQAVVHVKGAHGALREVYPKCAKERLVKADGLEHREGCRAQKPVELAVDVATGADDRESLVCGERLQGVDSVGYHDAAPVALCQQARERERRGGDVDEDGLAVDDLLVRLERDGALLL